MFFLLGLMSYNKNCKTTLSVHQGFRDIAIIIKKNDFAPGRDFLIVLQIAIFAVFIGIILLNLLMFLNVYYTIIYLIYSILTLINIIDFLSACVLYFFFLCMHVGVLSSARKSFYTPFSS